MMVVLALTVMLGVALFLAKSRMEYLRLPEVRMVSALVPADVTVIIPARNEEHNIVAAVRSFAGVAPVIVVDDASGDSTADLALSAGAVVTMAPPLESGRAGKPNACAAGASLAHSEWLLFVDADTTYRPELIPSLIAEARRNNLDMLSVFLRQDCHTFWERVVLPYAFALYFCGVNARRVNSPCDPDVLANGQCLLFRREAYQAIGGHMAVSTSVIEDAMLAEVAKRNGLRQRVMRAEHLGRVRMYDSLLSIWRGFEKNSFRFLAVNPLTGVQVVIASILLTAYVPLLILLTAGGHWVLALLVAAVPPVALLPWYGDMTGSLLSPLAIYVFQAIAWSSLLSPLLGRKAVWKGRRV